MDKAFCEVSIPSADYRGNRIETVKPGTPGVDIAAVHQFCIKHL